MSNKFWSLLIALFISLIFIFHSNNKLSKIKYDYEKQSRELQEINEIRIKKIEEARSIERSQLEENIRNLQRDLANNKIAYESQITSLQNKKKKEITVLAEKESSELADVVGSVTGFKVIQPIIK